MENSGESKWEDPLLAAGLRWKEKCESIGITTEEEREELMKELYGKTEEEEQLIWKKWEEKKNTKE